MRFEPVEKRKEKDNSILFYLRSSLVPVFADLIISCALGFLYLFSDMTGMVGRLIGMLAFGFWIIAFLGFVLSLVSRISTLVFVSKYRLYGQVYHVLPSKRSIELSLDEIRELEVRATIGTKVFHYAHIIIYPYRGQRIFLRNIRNADELALIILKLQDKLQKGRPETTKEK